MADEIKLPDGWSAAGAGDRWIVSHVDNKFPPFQAGSKADAVEVITALETPAAAPVQAPPPDPALTFTLQ